MALLFDKQFVIACIASLILIYFISEQLSNFFETAGRAVSATGGVASDIVVSNTIDIF